MHSVWFDFGDGKPDRFDFRSIKELNAFIMGVGITMAKHGINDYRQFDTQEQVDKFLAGNN